jgi:hypothetical protein
VIKRSFHLLLLRISSAVRAQQAMRVSLGVALLVSIAGIALITGINRESLATIRSAGFCMHLGQAVEPRTFWQGLLHVSCSARACRMAARSQIVRAVLLTRIIARD